MQSDPTKEHPVNHNRPIKLGGLALTTLVLTGLFVWAFGGHSARAAATATSCTVPSTPYADLQSAVDDPACATIELLAGVYTPTVMITRALTLHGAGASQSILDGEGVRRPLTIQGSGITVTVTALGLHNGDARASLPTVGLSDTGAIGGGLLISGPLTVELHHLALIDNRARGSGPGAGYGGAIGIYAGAVVAAYNLTLTSNLAHGSPVDPGEVGGYGGGIAVMRATLLLTDTLFQANGATDIGDAQGEGGALYLADSALWLARSTVRANTAQTGGAIYARVEMSDTGSVELLNSWIVANRGEQSLLFDGNSPTQPVRLRHVTLARPADAASGDIGLRVVNGHLVMTNSIVAGFTVGVDNGGGSIQEAFNLFADNGVNRTGWVTSSHPIFGSPDFVDVAAGDYHLGEASAAIDQGTALGIVDDITGKLRDGLPDVGGAEFREAPITDLTIQSLPTVVVGRPLTFTAQISTGTNVTYAWALGDGAVAFGNPITHAYALTGVYRVVVTATNPITLPVAYLTATARIQVLPLPISGASAYNDGPQVVGTEVGFTARLSDSVATSSTWDFGDGQVGSGLTTTHAYTASGSFTATVRVTNGTNTVTATTQVWIGDAVVDVLANEFAPRAVAIPVGGYVVWVLRAGTHSVTADDGSFVQPRGDDWPPFVQRFAQAGVYRYYSDVAGAPNGVGMAGTIHVQGAQRQFLPSLVTP
jgi:plastocyanin